LTSPPPEAGAAGPSERTASASLARRWGALIYEMLLVAAILLVTGFAVLPLLGTPAPASRGAEALQVLPAATRAFLFVYYFAVLGAYCVHFWTRGRRTLAMKTWRLALVTLDGAPLDAKAAIARYLAAWIGPAIGLVAYIGLGRWGLLAGLLNYGWAWLDRDRSFLHDRLASTRVTRANA
jgi:uncharacterized RDD family membrane protein YckC